MRPYIADHLGRGGKLHQITRHMLGLFHARPGARGWKRNLSGAAVAASGAAGLAHYDRALSEVIHSMNEAAA